MTSTPAVIVIIAFVLPACAPPPLPWLLAPCNDRFGALGGLLIGWGWFRHRIQYPPQASTPTHTQGL